MRMGKLSVYVLALMVAACGGTTDTGTQDPEQGGTLTLPLTTKTAEGYTYRLVNPTFEISGPQNVVIANTPSDTVSVPLTVGLYSIKLRTPWLLERTDRPGEPVQAELISPNPLAFNLAKGETTQVRFLFKLPGEGSADVGIHVDAGGSISGTIVISQASDSGPVGEGTDFKALEGQTVPFTLSFESSTITRELSGPDRELHVVTGPITFQFGATPSSVLASRVAPALTGATAEYSLFATPNGEVFFTGLRVGARTPTQPGRTFIFSLDQQMGRIPYVADKDGYPTASTIQVETRVSIETSTNRSRAEGMSNVRLTPQ